MKSIFETMRRLMREESGTEVVEWSVMAGMILVGLVLVISAIGAWTGTQFTTLQTEFGA